MKSMRGLQRGYVIKKEMEVVQRRWNLSCWLDQYIHFGRCYQHAHIVLLPLLPPLDPLSRKDFRNCKLSVISMSDLEKREEKNMEETLPMFKELSGLAFIAFGRIRSQPTMYFESLHSILAC